MCLTVSYTIIEFDNIFDNFLSSWFLWVTHFEVCARWENSRFLFLLNSPVNTEATVWQNFYTWPTNKDLRNLYNKGCRNVEPRILKARMKRKECQHYSLYWSKDSSHACSWGRKILVPGRYVSTKTHLLWHMKHVVPMYCFRSPKRSRNVATKPELRTKHSERIYLPWTLFEFDVS